MSANREKERTLVLNAIELEHIARARKLTRLKINLGGMPHLAEGLERELQAKNVELFKATKVKIIRASSGIDLAPYPFRASRSAAGLQSQGFTTLHSIQAKLYITRS